MTRFIFLQNLFKPLLILFFLLKPFLQSYTYDPYALRFINEKLEAKIDTNLFLLHLSYQQTTEPEICSSNSGPTCFFANNKKLAHPEPNPSLHYLIKKKEHLVYLRNFNDQYITDLQRATRSGTDILFKESSRRVLDEMLFPKNFPDFLITYLHLKPLQ